MTALCHCGRPFKHIGAHWKLDAQGNRTCTTHDHGPKHQFRPRLRSATIAAEIARLCDLIEHLKREIPESQARLLDAEARLDPLRALLDLDPPPAAPAPLALPPPDKPAPQPPRDSGRTKIEPKTPARFAPDSRHPPDLSRRATSADRAPTLVDLEQLCDWAAKRGVPCKGWGDLDAVNAKRAFLELPLFARRAALPRSPPAKGAGAAA